MGSYCKACDNQINEKHNEIIRQSGDLSMSNNTRNNIKESILKVKNDNIKDFIPEIIFLQRKIKKFLSSKHESNQEIFYKKNYSDLNYNQNEEFNIIGYKDENLEGNHLDKNTSIIDYILRDDSVMSTIMPFIDNVVSLKYPYMDDIKDLEHLKFDDFKKAIKQIDFSNYSITIIKDKEKKS